MEAPNTPCCSAPNCCSDKKRCVLCGAIAVVVLFLVAAIAFFLGKQLGLKQVPLCSPCPAQNRCPQAINQLPPVATSSAAVDPTAGWKTYQDQNNNFQVKYPSEWKVSKYKGISNYVVLESSGEMHGLEGNPARVNIEIANNTSIDSWLKTNTSINYPEKNWNPYDIEDVVISGYPGKKIRRESAIGSTYYLTLVNMGKSLYMISTINQDKTFDQILSTFKFN